MTVSAIVKMYIAKALKEEISIKCPGYGESAKSRVFEASMNGLHVGREVLYRAIELAAEDKAKIEPQP
jgi:hypothetical protein